MTRQNPHNSPSPSRRWRGHPLPTVIRLTAVLLALGALLLGAVVTEAGPKKKKKAQKNANTEVEDPYADFVWPPPPDEPRIKLEAIYSGRTDVEAESRLKKILIGASPQSPYDRLRKPFAVAIDSKGRYVVSDSATGALIRFDADERRMDVLGTRGAIRLKIPLGLHMAPDDTVYVADAGLKQVVGFDPEGKITAVFGRADELENPTDAALSPDGTQLYVADSKAHQIVVFDVETGRQISSLGRRGTGEGEFNFPTSLVFGPEGFLYVVDQINSRVQVFDREGEYLDQFGSLGVGFANFVRPKDIAVDEVGFIYVTDNAFNNFQLFDTDFTLLTFVGEGGRGPGRFFGASGIAVRGDQIAVVDQLGHRLQIFRFLVPKDQ